MYSYLHTNFGCCDVESIHIYIPKSAFFSFLLQTSGMMHFGCVQLRYTMASSKRDEHSQCFGYQTQGCLTIHQFVFVCGKNNTCSYVSQCKILHSTHAFSDVKLTQIGCNIHYKIIETNFTPTLLFLPEQFGTGSIYRCLS